MLLIKYLLMFIIFSHSEKPPRLTVTVDNINNIEGVIRLAVFKNDGNFLKKGMAYKRYVIKVNSKRETVVIGDLPPGTYAISLYHDKNSDGNLNLNALGLPKEPYAFSNNFRPKLAAPQFSDCKFDFVSDKKITISLLK